MTTSKATVIVGQDLTFKCVTTSNYVTFQTYSQTVCTVSAVQNNETCILYGSYISHYIYTCDKINGVYNLTIPGTYVSTLHKSKWRCGYPFGGSQSATINLYVNMPVTFVTLLHTETNMTSIVVEEGKTKRIECKTGPIRPPARIQWYLSTINITGLAAPQLDICHTNCNDDKVISSSVLVYTGDRRDNGKFLYCNAVNIDGNSGVNATAKQVHVEYGPSGIDLSPPYQSFTVIENATLGPITCTASCNPSCTYSWKGHGIIMKTNVLYVTEVKRSNSGIITCLASNRVGSFQKAVNVTVQYPANVKYLNSSNGNVTVLELSDVKLSCTAEGKPLPLMSWKVTDPQGNTLLMKTNDTGYSEFAIIKAKCGDTGRYTCIADNIIHRSSYKTVDLNVTCTPRQNASCSTNTTVEVRRNVQTTVNICWTSNPAPEVIWTLICDSNHTFTSTLTQTTQISYQSVLQKTFPDVATIVFKVVAKNGYGMSDPVYYEINVKNASNLAIEDFSSENKDLDKFLYLGTGFLTGVIVCVVTSFIIFRYRKEKSRNAEYSEFQSRTGMELQSYDSLDQQKCVQKEKNQPKDGIEHMYEECGIK